MHLLLIPSKFWFGPVITFHYYPIFLCPFFSNRPHRPLPELARIGSGERIPLFVVDPNAS